MSIELPIRHVLISKGMVGAMLLCVVAAAGGCSMSMSAAYSPVAATESLVEGEAKMRVYVTRFEDARPQKDSIGVMKNTFGIKVKNLVTSDDLELLMAEAATDALRKGGVTAGLHGERTATSEIPGVELENVDYVLGGRIKKINVESSPGWKTIKITAKVIIDVCVRRGEKIEWIGPIEGTAEMRDFNDLQSDSLTRTLDKAIGNCMRSMIRHLKASGSFEATKM